MKKILFPTDFSEASHRALCLAGEFIAPYHPAELHLVTVLEDTIPAAVQFEAGLSFVDPAEMVDEAAHAARERLSLEPFCDTLSEVVVRAVLRAQEGVAAEIVRYAEERGIDLIILATHGRSGLKHLVLGSVTESVVRAAPCPIVVLPPKMCDSLGGGTR